MKRKVVFEISDFNKLTELLNELAIPFSQAEKASKIKEALSKAIVMDIEIKDQNIRIHT